MNEKKDIDKYKNVCRTCLKENDKLISIFENVNEVKISDMLRDCTSIMILENDQLPKLICDLCIQNLKNCYIFKQQCCLSEKTLLFVYDSPIVAAVDTKTISVIEVDNEENNWKKENLDDSYSCHDDIITSDDDTKQPVLKKQETQFQCENCDEIFITKIARDNHFRRKHAIKKYTCKICFKGFIVFYALERHVIMHGFYCSKCFQKFNSELDLSEHKKEHKKPNVEVSCNICGKQFSRKPSLNQHVKIHRGEKAHLCAFCGKGFTLRGNLTIHMRIHTGVKPYECKICGVTFIQWVSLQSHLVTHTKEKLYDCTKCDKSFARKVVLRRHVKTVHSQLRKYPCPFCTKSFKTSCDLNNHKNIHTGEKIFKCTYCGKTFNRASTLRVHNRIHTGERPHVCKICNRGFIQFQVLKNHLKTHSKSNNEVVT